MIILILIWLHFIADFLLQSDKMALNKSTSFKWLTIHAITYGLPFFCWFFLSHGLVFAIAFTLVNAILHWIVDAITSRVTAKLWKVGERHWFFTVIGFDQAIHMTCLYLTYRVIRDIIIMWALVQ